MTGFAYPCGDMRNPSPAANPPLAPLGVPMLLRALFKQRRRDAPTRVEASYLFEGIDPGHLERYNAAFGYEGDRVPLTYLYLIAQRAQLATMLDRPLPFRIPGLIHVDNALSMHGPVAPSRPFAISTVARLLPPEENGAVQCVLETRASADGRTVFDCTSTYLVKRGSRQGTRPARSEPPSGVTLGTWAVAPNDGRRYAALSGDWNPIHLWPWSARLMGMREPIIHGMHTVAKACSFIQQTHGRPVVSLDCSFKSPVPLGSTVALLRPPGEDRFAALCNDRVAVDGKVAFGDK